MASSYWVHERDFNKKLFSAWLRQQKDFQPLENPGRYELMRYTRDGHMHFVYRNPSKGRVAFSKSAWAHFQVFLDGGNLATPTPDFIGDPETARELRLYTDASCYKETGVGSWAGVLVINPQVVCETSGLMRDDVTNSGGAEAMAIANSLHAFAKAGVINAGDQVRVFSDSIHVIGRLERRSGRQRKAHPHLAAAINEIWGIAGRIKVRLFFQWVKAHQQPDSTDPHAAYNRRADLLCTMHSRPENKRRTETAGKTANTGE